MAKPFRPTRAQCRFCLYVTETPAPLPLRELFAAAGISRSSYYRWSRQPGFRDWLGAAWLDAYLPLADLATMRDIGYLKAHMDTVRCFKPLFALHFGPHGLLALPFQRNQSLADQNEHISRSFYRPSLAKIFFRFNRALVRCRAAVADHRRYSDGHRKPRRPIPPLPAAPTGLKAESGQRKAESG